MKKLLTVFALSLLTTMSFAATTAKQIDFLAAGFNVSGKSLAGGKVYFYVGGSNFGSYSAPFMDKDKTAQSPNPLTLDANGRAIVYGDGFYDIKVLTSGGTQVLTAQNMEYKVNSIPNPLTVAYGGTGSSTASGARTNLGFGIGTSVQAWSAKLDKLSASNSHLEQLAFNNDANAPTSSAYIDSVGNLTLINNLVVSQNITYGGTLTITGNLTIPGTTSTSVITVTTINAGTLILNNQPSIILWPTANISVTDVDQLVSFKIITQNVGFNSSVPSTSVSIPCDGKYIVSLHYNLSVQAAAQTNTGLLLNSSALITDTKYYTGSGTLTFISNFNKDDSLSVYINCSGGGTATAFVNYLFITKLF